MQEPLYNKILLKEQNLISLQNLFLSQIEQLYGEVIKNIIKNITKEEINQMIKQIFTNEFEKFSKLMEGILGIIDCFNREYTKKDIPQQEKKDVVYVRLVPKKPKDNQLMQKLRNYPRLEIKCTQTSPLFNIINFLKKQWKFQKQQLELYPEPDKWQGGSDGLPLDENLLVVDVLSGYDSDTIMGQQGEQKHVTLLYHFNQKEETLEKFEQACLSEQNPFSFLTKQDKQKQDSKRELKEISFKDQNNSQASFKGVVSQLSSQQHSMNQMVKEEGNNSQNQLQKLNDWIDIVGKSNQFNNSQSNNNQTPQQVSIIRKKT